ncbi:MAG: hypothetical protein KDA24_14305 [Deltaproteobacteria bacterium]|nr:hypothetical protein [Deltaproteobacteria bacterium]
MQTSTITRWSLLALALAALLPVSGCLESPCSRHEQLCDEGPVGPGGPATCEVFPQATAGDLSDDSPMATDVWALRVGEEFEDLQVLDVVPGWNPQARMWIDPNDADEGLSDCSCNSSAGCPQVGVEVSGPSWVFVEVWDANGNDTADRSYTIHAGNVLASFLVRDGVAHAEEASDYNVTPPGLCDRNVIDSDVQLPWIAEIEGDTTQMLGTLEAPGICIRGVMTETDCSDRDLFDFEKLGAEPVRVTLQWDGPDDLDFVMTPGGTAQTQNNPETLLASVPNGSTPELSVSCVGTLASTPRPYALAIETY